MKRQEYYSGSDSPWWDKLLFNKIQEKFGGKLKCMVSGGAPLSAETQEFLSVVLNVAVMQGYGLTETCAGGTITSWDDRVFGRVGPPVPCCEIKLIDVPDMNYTSRDFNEKGESTPRGEIAIRGGNVASGYYKLEDKTAESFIEGKDGKGTWFLTGDIGAWDTDGSLRVIDRKKDLVKLMHGEYIAIGHLESLYRQSKFVENIAIHADSQHDAPAALVVPNESALFSFAHSKDIKQNLEELCKNSDVKEEVLKSLLAEADKTKMKKFERVAWIHLVTKPWTKEDGLLTEAMKLKRKPIYDFHQKDLEALYKTPKAE